MVFDTDFGIRQQTEQFYPLTEGDWDRINRDNVGFTRRAVPSRAEPAQRHSQGQLQRPELAELHVRQPAGRSGRGVADVDARQPDVDSGQPLVQGRLLLRAVAATRRAKAASAPGRGPGSSTSAPTPTTRSTPTTATPTRCSARSANYTEIDAFSEVIGKRYIAEFYVQDTWKATPAPDGRLRRALPVVHAVVLDAAGGGLRARALRSGQGAAALSAGASSTASTSRSIR